jgi:hypothetical protein
MNTTRFTLNLLLVAAIALSTSCKAKPPPDPSAGWKECGTFYAGESIGYHVDQAITDDYQAYITALPSDQRDVAKLTSFIDFREDGTGQHSVKIMYEGGGDSWVHILIYDKNNKRVKTIKYLAGHYQS